MRVDVHITDLAYAGVDFAVAHRPGTPADRVLMVDHRVSGARYQQIIALATTPLDEVHFHTSLEPVAV